MWEAIAQVAAKLIEVLSTIVTGEEVSLANADNQRTERLVNYTKNRDSQDRMAPVLMIFGAIVLVIILVKHNKNK